MKEFITVRYLIQQLRREDREQRYVNLVLNRGNPLQNWFKDVDIEVEESTKTLIQNIFKGTK